MVPVVMLRHDSFRAIHEDLTNAVVALSRHIVEQDAQHAAVKEPPHHGQRLQSGRHVVHGRYTEDTVASTLLHRPEVVSAGDVVACISAC